MKMQELQQEALTRATCGLSTANYTAIMQGFTAKGIPADDIIPRENVLTYHAWRALGRQVRKGEHGVRVLTFVPARTNNASDGTGSEQTDSRKSRGGVRPWSSTVFHISQTDPIA